MTSQRHTLQCRTDSGWQTIRGYAGERAGCRALAQVADNAPGGTYRLIVGDPNRLFHVVASRG